MQYSETRPGERRAALFCGQSLTFIAFIRGLLENVGAEIDPIRLIRRIQNGLEIPGLKEALIKILQAFNLQISLLEGCQTILEGDCATLARKLQKDQTKGFYEAGESRIVFINSSCIFHHRFHFPASTKCPICNESLYHGPTSVTVHFLCRHVVHLRCVSGGENVSQLQDPIVSRVQGTSPDISGKIAL